MRREGKGKGEALLFLILLSMLESASAQVIVVNSPRNASTPDSTPSLNISLSEPSPIWWSLDGGENYTDALNALSLYFENLTSDRSLITTAGAYENETGVEYVVPNAAQIYNSGIVITVINGSENITLESEGGALPLGAKLLTGANLTISSQASQDYPNGSYFYSWGRTQSDSEKWNDDAFVTNNWAQEPTWKYLYRSAGDVNDALVYKFEFPYPVTGNVTLGTFWYTVDNGQSVGINYSIDNVNYENVIHHVHSGGLYDEYFRKTTFLELNNKSTLYLKFYSYPLSTWVRLYSFNLTATLNTSTNNLADVLCAGCNITMGANGPAHFNWSISQVVGSAQLSEGQHTLAVYANDSAGDLVSTTRRFLVDTYAPYLVEILGPGNETLTSPVNVTWLANDNATALTVDLTLDWEVNVSGIPTENGSLTSRLLYLPDGQHSVKVTALDESGNKNESAPVYFTVDNAPPIITVTSPLNKSYYNATWFSATVTDSSGVLNVTVQVDGASNYTLDNTSGNWNYQNTSGLQEGTHAAQFFANDSLGNMNASEVVHFTIDRTPPAVTITSPANLTSTSNNTPLLNAIFGENVSAAWYAVNSTANSTPEWNTQNLTVELSAVNDGLYNATVFANDSAGNMNSTTVYFTVDTAPPVITIISPLNRTYSTQHVPLTYDVNEVLDWAGYSLDGAENITSGNTLLSYLSNGQYNVTLYANDSAGNMNSKTVYFAVKLEGYEEPPPAKGGGGGGGAASSSFFEAGVTKVTSDLIKDAIESKKLKSWQFYRGSKALEPVLASLGKYPYAASYGGTPRNMVTLAGEDYELAASKVLEKYTSASSLILARGDISIDSAAALAYAKKKRIPILLTRPKELPSSTINALKKLRPKEVMIVGGTDAVSTDIELELRSVADVERKWGPTRFETALEMAQLIEDSDMVILTDGTNQSSEAVLLSALYNAPIVYVASSYIPGPVVEFLERRVDGNKELKVLIVGVNETVAEDIEEIWGSLK